MNQNNKVYFYAGLSVVFWSTVATAFKIALRHLDFMQLIFYASGVTVFILFILLWWQGKLNLLKQQSLHNWLMSALLGALNPLLYYLILFKAYYLLPAQLAQPLNMIWPITLALLSVPLLNQKIGWINIIALTISFAGVAFISSQGSIQGFRNTNTAGVLLALSSSIVWSLYWILNVRDRRDEVLKLFLNFLFGFIFLAIVVTLFSSFRIGTGTGLYAAIYIGIFEAGITYVFWMKALKYSTNNARTGNIIFLSPFISLIFIRFVLGETIYITTFIGLVLIVAGIMVQQFEKQKSIA